MDGTLHGLLQTIRIAEPMAVPGVLHRYSGTPMAAAALPFNSRDTWVSQVRTFTPRPVPSPGGGAA